MVMKTQVLMLLTGLLVGCSGAPEANVLNRQNSSFSFSSRSNTELAPYIQETLAEMKDDYRNAVSLHEAMQHSPAYGYQYALIEKYIEFLLPAIGTVEQTLERAQNDSLTESEYEHYVHVVSEWREKSTTVFGAVGRSL